MTVFSWGNFHLTRESVVRVSDLLSLQNPWNHVKGEMHRSQF